MLKEISFWSNRYTGSIAMQSFKLYDTDNIEMTNTRILTQATDPNARFSAYEFALFPLERLNWNSNYRAEFIYTEDNELKNKTWFFKTRATLYPYYQVESNNQTLQVISGKPYVIYIQPTDCNDTFNGYNYSYSGLSVDSIGFNDLNSIYVQVSGAIGNSMTVNLNNNTSFTIVISATDSALSNTSIPAELRNSIIDFGDQFGIRRLYSKISLRNVLCQFSATC